MANKLPFTIDPNFRRESFRDYRVKPPVKRNNDAALLLLAICLSAVAGYLFCSWFA